MKYFKNVFKISLILILLIMTVGSIYAADNADSPVSDYSDDDDFELDDDEGYGDDDDGYGDDDDGYGDDDESDDSDWEDDEDFEEDDENDEDDWDDEDDDWEDEDDFNYTDFDFLEYKIIAYLDQYGNCTDENWTESEDFLKEYEIYLTDPSKYTLNESAEGYKTYLKIYDSITSTFGDYNLTENETAYLKFIIIYYLNHYGNVSANYTWNESESFANFTPPDYLLTAMCTGMAASAPFESNDFLGSYFALLAPSDYYLEDVNQTSTNNQTSVESAYYSWDVNIFALVLLIVVMILVIL